MLTITAAIVIGTAVLVAIPAYSGSRLPRDSPTPTATGKTQRSMVVIAASVAPFLLLPRWWTAVMGAVAGWVMWRLMHRTSQQSADVSRIERQAAEVAELLSACLASGATLERSSEVVARAVGPPVSPLLLHVSALVELGSPAHVAWAKLDDAGALSLVSGVVRRSLQSGAPLADALESCARDLRDQHRARVETMARSVAVTTVGPLGLCFLPAFLLLTVVPIVASLLTTSGVLG